MPERLLIALRLKAARYLAGKERDGRAVPLPPRELVTLPRMAENSFKKSRVEEIEQMKVDARPWELEAIASALGLPADWFSPQTALEQLLAGETRRPPPPHDAGSDEDEPERRAGAQ